MSRAAAPLLSRRPQEPFLRTEYRRCAFQLPSTNEVGRQGGPRAVPLLLHYHIRTYRPDLPSLRAAARSSRPQPCYLMNHSHSPACAPGRPS